MTTFDDEIEILARILPMVDERLRAAVEAPGRAFPLLPIVLDAATSTVIRIIGELDVPLEVAGETEVDCGIRVFLQGAVDSRTRELIRRDLKARRAARRRGRRPG